MSSVYCTKVHTLDECPARAIMQILCKYYANHVLGVSMKDDECNVCTMNRMTFVISLQITLL